MGAALVDHPGVDKIMFTGSAAPAQEIAATAAGHLTPTTMELGGNDAAIVLPDADPKAMAMGLFWGAFLNMGQTCACAKRLYVPDAPHDAVVAELKVLAEAMPMGNGMEPGARPWPDPEPHAVRQGRRPGATGPCRRGHHRLRVSPLGPGLFYPYAGDQYR